MQVHVQVREAIKWILRYLKGTTNHGIMFDMEQGIPLVVGYVDYDHADDLDDRRSTTRCVFTLVGDLYARNHQFNLSSYVYN